jgi:hypothetical protein
LNIAFRLHEDPASGVVMGLDVFISYSHHDKVAADAACAMLESSGGLRERTGQRRGGQKQRARNLSEDDRERAE